MKELQRQANPNIVIALVGNKASESSSSSARRRLTVFSLISSRTVETGSKSPHRLQPKLITRSKRTMMTTLQPPPQYLRRLAATTTSDKFRKQRLHPTLKNVDCCSLRRVPRLAPMSARFSPRSVSPPFPKEDRCALTKLSQNNPTRRPSTQTRGWFSAKCQCRSGARPSQPWRDDSSQERRLLLIGARSDLV